MKMKVLGTIYWSMILFGVISADTTDKKKEQVDAFYKCIACGTTYLQAEFEKCGNLQPEKAKLQVDKCLVQLNIPTSFPETWTYRCQNPVKIEQMYDCLYGDLAFWESFTAEENSAYETFLKCTRNLKGKYCSFPVWSLNGPTFSSAWTSTS